MEHYRKIKQIGAGSFGQAWLVESTVSRRTYALKELGVTAMSEQDRQLARNEANILSQLKHKNVVRYKEAFFAEGKLCIAMEYAEKGDLYSRIKERNGRYFSETQILDWFTQLCLALKYIHGQNILHRDLKTQNIFLGKDDIIKLGDFGIARMLNSTLDHAQTTVGTPYYLSPEICQRKPYNHKSDMWSIGCVLYEMTTLKHAFNADNFSALVIKILQGQYPPIPQFYGPLLEDLVAVLLRRNPEERPSAKQLLYVPSMQPYVGKFLYYERNRTDSEASCVSDTSTRSAHESSQIASPTKVTGRRSSIRKKPVGTAETTAISVQGKHVHGNENKLLGEKQRRSSCATERRCSADSSTSGPKVTVVRENVPAKPSHLLAHAQNRRDSMKTSMTSRPVSRATKTAIQTRRTGTRAYSEAYDSVFAENQPTMLPLKRQETSGAPPRAHGTEKTNKNQTADRTVSSSLVDINSVLPAVQPNATVKRRHQSALTVIEANCWHTQQKHPRLTGKETGNENAKKALWNVVAKQQKPSTVLQPIQRSNTDVQATSETSTETTGNEREFRKRTYTVSHARRPSKFELPDVIKENQCKGVNERQRAPVTGSQSLGSARNSKTPKPNENLLPGGTRNEEKERKVIDSEVNKEETLRRCLQNAPGSGCTEATNEEMIPAPCKFTFCGKTLSLDNITNEDSVYAHMEALRMYLETKLGLRLLTDVYRCVTGAALDGQEELQERVVRMLGEQNMSYFPVVLQLVASETLYFR